VQHAVDAFRIFPAEVGFSFDATPSRCALLVAVVTAPGIVVPDLATTRPLEALRSTLVCLHFRHVSLLPGGRGEPWLFLVRVVTFVLKIISRRIPRRYENHGHVPTLELWHRLDLAVVRNVVVETFEDVPAQLGVGHFATSEAHGAFDLVTLAQELHDTFPFHIEVTCSDLRTELHFLDHRAGLVLACFPCLDGLVVLELAVVHHPHNRRTGIRGDLNKVETELGGQPSSFVDVLLTDLGAIGRYQTYTLDADSVIDPWFSDGDTSWYIVVFAQKVAYRNMGSTARCCPLFGTWAHLETVDRWEAGASSCVVYG